MTQAVMRYCAKCADYTLKDVCPRCGAKAAQKTPAKFSPEDHYGVYRRKLKKMDAAKKSA